MSSQSLFSLSRVALLIGCALIGIGSIGYIAFSGAGQAGTGDVSSAWLMFVGIVFLNLGLPALYARFAERAGKLGAVGYTLLQIFFLLEIVDFFLSAVILPYLDTASPTLSKSHPPIGVFLAIYLIAPVLGMLGGLLSGIAFLRVGAQSRLPGILLIGGAAVLLVSGFLPHPGAGANVFVVAVLLNVLAFAWLSFSAGAGVGANAPVSQAAVAR